MNSIKLLAVGFFVVLLLFGCIDNYTSDVGSKNNQTNNSVSALKKFNSTAEMKEFIINSNANRYYYSDVMLTGSVQPLAISKSAEYGASDYSTTNIQVAGVDEADFIKNDGEFLYVISGNKLYIIDAYPAEDLKIVSEVSVGTTEKQTKSLYWYNHERPVELFLHGDHIVLFATDYANTTMFVYDVSNKNQPLLEKQYTIEGNYFDSRMVDNSVYVIVNKPIYYYGYDIEPPILYSNNSVKLDYDSSVYYFDEPASSYMFTTVFSFDVHGDSIPQNKIFLIGTTQDLYVSQDAIYVTYQQMPVYKSNQVRDFVGGVIQLPQPDFKQETSIHKIKIKDGNIQYQASGSVPGYVLNQFSMDEYNGYFRVATTTSASSWRGSNANSKNNIYILDSNLDTVGKLENLAPGESIYSARFMGNKAYLVTFRKVDPLFVVNMSDPTSPTLLGKLKIPGYSDYLQPYDENHIIGIGKEAIADDTGDFSWYQGVKLSLFDVSDISNPKETSKYEIGDRGTDSYALRDHKAVLFDKEKNLLVIPVLVAEIDHSKYSSVEKWQYGDYVFQGAFVFNISSETGFKLKGTVTHLNNSNDMLKSGYYYSSPYDIKRSLYMDDNLYTISDKKIKITKLSDLNLINEIELS